MTSDEIIDLSPCLVTLVTVTFLNSADQLVSVTLGPIEIVVRQLSPLRLNFTFELAPFPLQDVFIHDVLLSLDVRARGVPLKSPHADEGLVSYPLHKRSALGHSSR